jgi:hypothetical protein
MRMLVKIQIPSFEGNIGLKEGILKKLTEDCQSKFKVEAMYFLADQGLRTAMIFMEMKDPSEMPAIAEPWFQALNASIEMTPVMIPADLEKAQPDIEKAIKEFSNPETFL